MVRRVLFLLLVIALFPGCGQTDLGTPYEQGEAQLRRGKYDQAIASLTEAIRIEPHNAGAYVFRGRAYQGRNEDGDLDAAINDFTAAIEIKPKDYEAYYSRSIAFRDRGDANQSEEDLAASRADHAKARKFDPSIADTYATLPEFTEPVEAAIPPPAEPRENPASEMESPFDARRRVSAAAADRGDRFAPDANGKTGLGAHRSLIADPEEEPDVAREESSPPPGLRRRIYPDTPAPAQSNALPGMPPENPLRGVAPTLSPLTPSANSTAPPLTPTPSASTPNRGGTLPPVGSSPFATPFPSALPGGPAGVGGSMALQGATPNQSPFQSPYQSQFPPSAVPRGPAPTGILPSQTLPSTTGRQPQRPAVTPIPGRINFPATTRPGIYNP